MPRMHASTLATLSLMMASTAAPTHAQDAVQWRVEDGGNGHWYQLLVLDDFTYEPGLFSSPRGAHPATLVNSDESDWVFEHVASNTSGWTNINGALVGPCIGLGNPCDGAWYWITGEPFGWSNWAAGEPSSGCDGVVLYSPDDESGPQSSWAMFESVSPDGFLSIVLEWSADCNGDGLVDYGQIASGELADADDSGIPDICEAPVQWETAAGGNGHWYQYNTTIHQQRDDARSDAIAVGGELVSITSPDEDAFVDQVIDTLKFSHSFDVFTGGYNAGGSWAWTTGEAWTFADWHGTQGNAPYVEIVGRVSASSQYQRWGTAENGGNMTSMIEWSADCNEDGIVDYGQIIDGTFSDDDGNGVPDICEPVQWQVEDGGNGHWYTVIESGEISFDAARSAAIAMGGDLGVVDSEAANEWVVAELLSSPERWLQKHGPWIGLFQDRGAPDYVEPDGGWYWVNGEPLDYSDWAPGEGCEDMPAELRCSGEAGCDFATYYALDEFAVPVTTWGSNVADGDTWQTSYLVEWSADCNEDGIVDYGQIRDGTFSDDDGNGVPDPCEQPGGFDGILDVPSEYATIQEAIDDCPDGGVIQIAEGTFQPASTLDPLGRAVTIRGTNDGDGNPVTILDGRDSFRIAVCENGEGSDTVFENLVFTNGYTNDGGGALYIDGASPTVRNCVFQNCVAGGGGAVACRNQCTSVFTDCTFIENDGESGGGALYCYGNCHLTIAGCLFRGNTTSFEGGGFYASYLSAADILDSVFETNHAGGRGGAVFLSEGGTISGSTFTGNTASDGGAVDTLAGARISNSDFQGNSASLDGGAIRVIGGGETIITDSHLSANRATFGGAIRVEGTTLLVGDVLIDGNVAVDSGGGISGSDASITVTDSVIQENIIEGSQPGAPPGTFVHDYGAGIQVSGGTLIADGTDVSRNRNLAASNYYVGGAGLAIFGGTGHEIRFCTIEENVSETSQVGGLWIESGPLLVEHSVFSGNSSLNHGALLANGDADLRCSSCVFIENSSTSSSEGRGVISAWGRVALEDCILVGNTTAEPDMGVAYSVNSSSTILDSLFCNNLPGNTFGPWQDLGGNIEDADCPVEFDVDCNGDGILDFIQIFEGTVTDCDENGIPDDCDLTATYAATEPGTPAGPTDYVTFDVSSLPDARDTVSIEISALGELAGPARFLIVYLDEPTIENRIGVVFAGGGENCLGLVETLEMPVGGWNDAGIDGSRSIIIAGSGLDPICGDDAYTGIDVTVPLVFEDCNANDLWDACEVADGSVLDSDEDGVIDDCDGCPDDPNKTDPGICGCGEPESDDTDGDGILDCIDPCPSWPYDCSEDGQTLFVTVGQPVQLAVDLVPAGGVVELGAGTHVGTGDRVVTFAGKPMTLRGATGGEPVIIDGEFTRRGLYCIDPAASGSVVENLEIRNGDFGFAGGGAHLRNTGFTFTNCRFIGNRAGGPGYEGSGGGLYAYQSTVNLDQCFFEANSSLLWGGGVCIDESSVIASNCEFLQNTSSDSGGGMHINLGQFTISNCRFTGNTASAFGGGFNNGEGGSGSLVDCEFDSNGTDGKGGGAYLEDLGSLSAVLRCTFTGNSARSGGAVHCEDSDATITECLFEGNSTFGGDQAYGGAVRVLGGSSSIIEICIFRNNTAYNGGGLQVGSSAAIVRDCTFESNDASNGGGGLNGFPDSDVTVVDCVFFGNSARVGGGVTSTNGAISFEGCSLTGNVHTDLSWSGGGFHGDTPTLLDTTICGNLPDQISGDFTDLGGNCITDFCDSDEDGVLDCEDVCPGEDDLLDTDEDGTPDCLDPCPTWPHDCSDDGSTILVAVGQSIQDALYAIPEGGTVEIAAGTFNVDGEFGLLPGSDDFSIRGAIDEQGLPATILDAGGDGRILGIDFGQSEATVLENLVLTNGERLSNGGALGISMGSTPIIRNCHFIGNRTGSDGGAVFVTDASPTFIDCRFAGNFTAVDGEGGGLYLIGGMLTMTGCTFDSNEAGGGGGLVLENAGGSVTMSDFIGNLADRGGAVYLGSSDLDLTGSRFEGNVATVEGGGIDSYQSSLRIDSSILCGNTPDQVFGDYTDLGGNCILDECGDDLDDNGIPDACDPDCNGDGIPDGLETDCDGNGIPDECEIADGTADDCNGNGVPDSCDIADGSEEDENTNQIPDSCDIAAGDLNVDGCIDAGDLGLLIALWGLSDPPLGDLNGDGFIAAADLGLLIGNWAPCDP